MDGTITSAAKKREATETGTTHSSRGFLHQGVSYFIIFLYGCIYLKNTSSFTRKSHVSSGKIPQVVSQVGVNCLKKFKGDPSKPYCSACCKGLLAKAASKSPGNRSKQEKIHDPQLRKLQNTFKKTVKMFKSEEIFASERDTFPDTETLQIANDLDATWSRPCKYLCCSLSSRPSASPHTSLVDSMHHQKSPKKKSTLKSFPSLVGLRSQ